jgi:predicted ATPase
MLLARLASSRTTEWHSIQSALSGFGKGSGLFDSIQVVRKGKKQSDPFQLNVKIKGPSFNLVDVGYGVSQVLPILVDSLQERRETTQLLLQQPEVHLHPKAQAELGSFFAHTTKKHGVRFVIETHSDHLIDRIRMAIRDGKLKPQDVSLLFFERRESEAAIHTLKLDEQGQILDAPASYRRFFLTEERRILGLD